MRLLATFLAVAILALAACEGAPEEGPSPDATPASGIQGRVLLGPTCPVERQDTPCPDEPYAASVVVWNAERTQQVATFETGTDGRFRVPLPPGEYYVDPQPPQSGPPPTPMSQTVTVPADRFVEVTIEYDSGIR